jgi:hypothetical protein
VKLRPGWGLASPQQLKRLQPAPLRFPYRARRIALTPAESSLNGFPFSIIYRPEADGIVVLAVAHTYSWNEKAIAKFAV